jgi:glycosyltransferase involved in cell wall biosynthesis
LRVLLRATYPPPYGGIATALTAAAPWLVQRGHELVFMTDSSADRVEHPQPNVTVVRYSSRARWKRLANPATLARMLPRILRLVRLGASLRTAVAAALASDAVEELVRRYDIDVVSVYMLSPAFYLAAQRTPASRPTVVTVFGDLFDDPALEHKPRLVRAVLNAADGLLSPSHYCASSVERVGMNPESISVLTLGVDVRRFAPDVDSAALRVALGLSASDRVILFLGRFDDEMGVLSALACVPEVLKQEKDVVFVFAGATGGRSGMVRETADQWRGRVVVKQDVPGAEVPSLMTLASVLLAPTKAGHPCCGMALKEAMAAGVPIVATDTGGHREVIDNGTTGHLIPIDATGHPNREALVGRIVALVRDDPKRRAMGTAGRNKALATFDARDTAAAMERAFAAADERRARSGTSRRQFAE